VPHFPSALFAAYSLAKSVQTATSSSLVYLVVTNMVEDAQRKLLCYLIHLLQLNSVSVLGCRQKHKEIFQLTAKETEAGRSNGAGRGTTAVGNKRWGLDWGAAAAAAAAGWGGRREEKISWSLCNGQYRPDDADDDAAAWAGRPTVHGTKTASPIRYLNAACCCRSNLHTGRHEYAPTKEMQQLGHSLNVFSASFPPSLNGRYDFSACSTAGLRATALGETTLTPFVSRMLTQRALLSADVLRRGSMAKKRPHGRWGLTRTGRAGGFWTPSAVVRRLDRDGIGVDCGVGRGRDVLLHLCFCGDRVVLLYRG
jgi:hypothetical protein